MSDLANVYNLGTSPDWQALLSHFDLGEGFAFIVLLVPNDDGAEVCRVALDRYLEASGKRVHQIPVSGLADLRNIAHTLLGMTAEPADGAIWLARAVPVGVPDYAEWRHAWREGVSRLNEHRNPLRRQFDMPVIFAGAPWLQEVLREDAPDLWSVRTLVACVEPQALKTAAAETREGPPRAEPASGPDPELALAEADRLRGNPGSELGLARLLYRAGLGFAARYQRREAAQAFEEALDIRRRSGAAAEDLADAGLELAEALAWLTDYDRANDELAKARQNYHATANTLGEAHCMRRLGDIALRRSDHDTARRRYEEASPLYRRVGDVLGEANCIQRLGDIALRRSDHERARSRYQEALPLYQRMGDVLGEANCIKGTGDIALDRSDHETARSRYQEALPLYQRMGHVLGEANCIKGLGDIAVARSDYETARSRYEEALPLFRRVGDVLGEANCIRRLGDIALDGSDHETARTRSEEALPLYRRVGDVLGEANCIQNLGNIAAEQGEMAEARERYEAAMGLYQRIPEPYSIGRTYRRLARVTDGAERSANVAKARAAWQSIGRTDLMESLDGEFPPEPAAAPGETPPA